MKIPYLIIVFGIVIWGILILAFQNCKLTFWVRMKEKVSLGLGAIGPRGSSVGFATFNGFFHSLLWSSIFVTPLPKLSQC
ncbi:MAG: hypothetical protein ACI4ES_09625 [Roseburia sp.]